MTRVLPGQRVRWTTDGLERTGHAVRLIPAGEAPTLPVGVARCRHRFNEAPSTVDRMLVLFETPTTGDYYYAPHVDSLVPVILRVRKMVKA